MGKISEIFNFDNIGGKIKNFAKWSCWITILLIWIAAPISFIVLVSDDWTAHLCWIPLVSAIVDPVLVWIGSWSMYALGEFVEDTHAMRKKYYPMAEEQANREAEERAKHEAEAKAKHEAELKAQREATEKARRETEEKAKEQEAEIEQPSGEQCQLCGKYFEHLSYCKITDEMGTRYRNICDDCIQKHNATKQ